MRQWPRITNALTIAMATMFFAIPQLAPVYAGTMQTYIVLYKADAVPAGAATWIVKAGGTLVYSYDMIGVVIARSDDPAFRENLLKDNRIENAASTAAFGVRLNDDPAASVASARTLGSTPVPDGDNLSGLQWDMRQIHVPEAHAITGGSQSIIVGDIDTGLDFTHPDLAANYDAANSADCTSGAPAQLLPGNDKVGHGTHTAGTIAAAANGIGVVGVAPNVRIAGIKGCNDDGFCFPEATICAFMWAGTRHLNVTNNSYSVDPWLFNCRNDPVQRAIWKAERRAIRYAMQQGVVVVAAAGNFSDDLAHPTQDIISPDDNTPITRTVHNDCAVIPVEIPGVLGVTANGNLRLKSYYSNYGVGVTQVIAPGGDRILQITPDAPNGQVLSTLPPGSVFDIVLPPSRKVLDCSVSPCALYGYLQGTSMATPHVTGVAALIMSMGVTSPGAVVARINDTADAMECPDTSIYEPFPSASNGAAQVCQGGKGYNSFNGHGQVNALRALKPTP